MALTYIELVRRVPIWLYAQNTALVAEMPAIVEQAQDRLEQVIHHDQFKTVISPLSVGTDGLLDLSGEVPRVLEVRGLRVRYRDRADGWVPLKPREAEALSLMFVNDRPGTPRYYTEFGGPLQLKLYPKPPAALDAEVTANVVPTRISETVPTNIYTEQFPRAIEMSCMHYAAKFMKNYEDAGIYEQEMMAALSEAGAQVARRRRDETERRTRDTTNMAGG